MRLGTLLRKDVPRCAELEQELFAGEDPWTARMFVSEIDAGHFYIGAFDEDEHLVGYAGLAVIGAPPNAEAEVHTIAVDAKRQGEGIGKALLRALLARADAVNAVTFLEVRTGNETAKGLYVAHDFEIVGLRKRYYQPSGADAHTMRRPSATEREGKKTS
ncbi:ribosomal protein S18-alanine N-acetyltransferase [Allokutzneria sp. A3M-2-11 16]|uniref:ribosomal protein S18-alanine N-acetyltransferase n=1 Tax=Allokutzneria sp. A3M-2-11 16 TaxID=2962043 RepID=UPI0020B83912|nr:ribosomal protein S18-alanine N-acetyltransferase [Allokutzneria sp. A3M-2-11 16]MCP3798833.1 ribosomal protein S18-alanine N-acetyltransferase [Allokutzneria sp. A3M-2-11 16]